MASPDEPVTVDPADRGDVAALVDCWVELVADQQRHGAHIRPHANRETAGEFLAQQVAGGSVHVARVDDDVVGFVSYHVERGVYEQDATRGIVQNLFVRPAYRERGIGSRLLDAAETALDADGAGVIAITALADNAAARRLYEARGYEPHRLTFERPAPGGSDTHSREDDG